MMDYLEAKQHALEMVQRRKDWPCIWEGSSGWKSRPAYCAGGDKLTIGEIDGSCVTSHREPNTHTFSIAKLRAELASPQEGLFA